MHPFGVGDGRQDPATNAAELDMLASAGANTARMDVPWPDLEPSPGLLDVETVAFIDDFVDLANARGIKPILNFHSTPCWASANPDKDCSQGPWNSYKYPPADASAYGRAAAFLANRYEGRLAGIELWNEPDLDTFLRVDHLAGAGDYDLDRTRRANIYADMVRASYPRIKDVAPSLPVVVGAIEGSDASFLQMLYDAGVRGHYDALSFHPYNGPDSPTSDRPGQASQYVFKTGVPRMRDVMVSNGDSAKPIWLTEFGWPTCTDGDFNCVSEADQALFIKQAFQMIRRDFGYVQTASVYELRNSRTGNCRECQYGLLRGDFSEKPAYPAFVQALKPAYRETVDATPGLISYWRLGEASGFTAVDRRGVMNGTYSSDVALRAPGISGADGNTSVRFDLSDAVTIPDSVAYDLNGFTVELWVRLMSYGNTSDYRPLIRKGDRADNRTFGLFLAAGSAGRVHFSFGTGTGYVSENSNRALQLDRWHHLAFVHPAGGRPALYIDGELDKSSAFSGVPATGAAPIRIRADYTGGSGSPNARVDEVAIYNRALPSAEIRDHHAAGVFPGP